MEKSIVLEIKVDTKGLLNALKKAGPKTLDNVSLELKKGARDIQLEARTNHRYTSRSGDLDRSIETRNIKSKLTSKVGFNENIARYGKYLHGGLYEKNNFKSYPPDEFIYKAQKSNIDDIKKNVEKAVKRSIKGAFSG